MLSNRILITVVQKQINWCFFVSRRKSLTEINNQNQKSLRDVSRVFPYDCKSLTRIFCLKNHPLCKNINYMALPVPEKIEVIKKNNYCFNCLRKHLVNNCKYQFSCLLCKREEGKNKEHPFSLHYLRNYESLCNTSAIDTGGSELFLPT